MIKKTVTYKNFDGITVTRDLYFHLTEAEIVRLEVSFEGGLAAAIKAIDIEKDSRSVIDIFEKIIKASYGTRTPEGEFRKNKDAAEDFLNSESYSALFMELVTDAEKGAAFVRGVMPESLNERMDEAENKKKVAVENPPITINYGPVPPNEEIQNSVRDHVDRQKATYDWGTGTLK